LEIGGADCGERTDELRPDLDGFHHHSTRKLMLKGQEEQLKMMTA
jgi:hypothetical protein